MTDPLVVLVFVLATGERGSATPAMVAAARQALGAETVLLIEQSAALPPEAEALRDADRVRASAVVELDLLGERTTAAVLHVHTAQRPGWTERTIEFASNEPATEYGRTVGFAMASMITGVESPPGASESERAAAPSPPTATESEHAGTPSRPAAPAAPENVGVLTPTPAAPSVDGKAAPRPGRSEPSSERRGVGPGAPSPRPFAVEAVAIGTGFGSSSNGAGASVSASSLVLPWLAIQIDTEARFGSVVGAQATFASWQFGAGATWRSFTTLGPRPFEVDLRVDLFADDLLVYRGGANRSRWLPGASLALEAVWFVISRSVGIVAEAGGDASFGTTTVAVGNDTVATIAPFRAMGALGVRTQF